MNRARTIMELGRWAMRPWAAASPLRCIASRLEAAISVMFGVDGGIGIGELKDLSWGTHPPLLLYTGKSQKLRATFTLLSSTPQSNGLLASCIHSHSILMFLLDSLEPTNFSMPPIVNLSANRI